MASFPTSSPTLPEQIRLAAELYPILTAPELSGSDTGIAYRVINHWDQKGIIRFSRNSAEGMRRFSLIDFVWIKAVEEMRTFGISVPQLHGMAERLYQSLPAAELRKAMKVAAKEVDDFAGLADLEISDADLSSVGVTYLQSLILEAVTTRKSVSLILFRDGSWCPFLQHREDEYPPEVLYRIRYTSHLSINLTEIIFDQLMDEDFAQVFSQTQLFGHNEGELVKRLRERKYASVWVIPMDDGPPVEIKKDKQTLERVMRHVRLLDYRDIIVVAKNGTESHFPNTFLNPIHLNP